MILEMAACAHLLYAARPACKQYDCQVTLSSQVSSSGILSYVPHTQFHQVLEALVLFQQSIWTHQDCQMGVCGKLDRNEIPSCITMLINLQ